MGGGGGGGGSNPLQDIFQQWQGKEELPQDREGLAANMMERGRSGFDFSKMGAVLPLAGQVNQPSFSTPPPQFNKDFWMNWEKGDSVDGSKYKGSVTPGDFDKFQDSKYKQDRGGGDDDGGGSSGSGGAYEH